MDAHEHLRRYPLNVVLASLGFETFKYRKNGSEGFGACPVHGSKRNTTCFSFNDDGLWRCFSCPAKGKGALDLVMAVKQCGFKDAVSFLQGISGAIAAKPTESPAPEPVAVLTENKPFSGASYAKYQVPSPWLAARGLADETLKKFGVFCYNNPARNSAYTNKVMIPVHRFTDGQLVAYLARDTNPDAEVKYQWPKGFQKSLEVFGAWQIKNSGQKLPLRVVYVVESPFCVLKFHQLGLPAVSPFGYSVSAEQVAILAQIAKGVCYLPDRDKSQVVAGFVQQLSRMCWIRNPELPEGVDDPEQLSMEQIRSLTGSA